MKDYSSPPIGLTPNGKPKTLEEVRDDYLAYKAKVRQSAIERIQQLVDIHRIDANEIKDEWQYNPDYS